MFRVVNPDGSLKEYGYDASGMRIREKAADGVTREFYPDYGKIPFFGSERISGADIPEGSNAAVSYTGEGVKPLAACVGTSTASGSAKTKTVYFLDDHLGSILALTDENGNIITHYNHDEFGIMTTKREILPNPLTTQPSATGFPGYTGQYHDQTAGLLYLRNRFYNPAIGRFTQIDPIYLDNQYAYIPEGNPVNYTDPSGLNFGGYPPMPLPDLPPNKPCEPESDQIKEQRKKCIQNCRELGGTSFNHFLQYTALGAYVVGTTYNMLNVTTTVGVLSASVQAVATGNVVVSVPTVIASVAWGGAMYTVSNIAYCAIQCKLDPWHFG